MKILIAGDSHTGPIQRGLNILIRANDVPRDVDLRIQPLGMSITLPTPFFADRGSHVEFIAPDYRERMTYFPPQSETQDAIGLSMPLFPLRLLRRLYADGWRLTHVGPGCRTMSRAVFAELVKTDLKYVLALVGNLRRNGHVVFAVGAPGIFEQSSIMRQVPASEAIAGFRLYTELARAELDTLSCPAVLPPAECFLDSGLMRPEFRHPDPTDPHHGNDEFGKIMIREIATWARRHLTPA